MKTAKELDKAFDPLQVSLLGSEAVSVQPHEPGNLIDEWAFTHGSAPPERTV